MFSIEFLLADVARAASLLSSVIYNLLSISCGRGGIGRFGRR